MNRMRPVLFALVGMAACAPKPPAAAPLAPGSVAPGLDKVKGGVIARGCAPERHGICRGAYVPAFSIQPEVVRAAEFAQCIEAGFCQAGQGDESPAGGSAQVSWSGAKAYCAWKGLRLPTEEQWERAVESEVFGLNEDVEWLDGWYTYYGPQFDGDTEVYNSRLVIQGQQGASYRFGSKAKVRQRFRCATQVGPMPARVNAKRRVDADGHTECAPLDAAAISKLFVPCPGNRVGQKDTACGGTCAAVCQAFDFTRCQWRAQQRGLYACEPDAPQSTGKCDEKFGPGWISQCVCAH